MSMKRIMALLLCLALLCLAGCGGKKEVTYVDGTYEGQQLRLYPAQISGTSPQSNFQPVLVKGTDAKYVMSLIQDDSTFRLNPYDEELGYAEQDYLPAK